MDNINMDDKTRFETLKNVLFVLLCIVVFLGVFISILWLGHIWLGLEWH